MAYDRDDGFLSVLPLAQDHVHGVLDAAVILVIYGDYEWFQSASLYRLIKVAQQQLNTFGGENDLCFIFHHSPQVQIHPHTQRAAEAAETAAQGHFWHTICVSPSTKVRRRLSGEVCQ